MKYLLKVPALKLKHHGALPYVLFQSITLEPTGGTEISEVIDEGIKIAKHFGAEVKVNFNGTPMTMGARSDPDRVFIRWQKRRERR